MHLVVAGLLHRQEEGHGERHDHEIDERSAEQEQDRCRGEERQKGFPLATIKPRRHEHVDLRGDYREGDEDGAEQRKLHLGKEEFLRRGVDHLDRRIDAGREPVGPEQEIVEGPREIEADGERDSDRAKRPDQPATELDEMLHQRRLGGVDVLLILVAHDAPSSRFLARGLLLGAAVLAGTVLSGAGFFARGLGLGLGAGSAASAAAGTGSAGVRHHQRLVDGSARSHIGHLRMKVLHGFAHFVDLAVAHGLLELSLEVGRHVPDLAEVMAEGAH